MKPPFAVGDYVTPNYRVPPFLSDDILTVQEVRNVGTKKKPVWRFLCIADRGETGWMYESYLDKVTP